MHGAIIAAAQLVPKASAAKVVEKKNIFHMVLSSLATADKKIKKMYFIVVSFSAQHTHARTHSMLFSWSLVSTDTAFAL